MRQGMVLIGYGGAGSSHYNPCIIENNGLIIFGGDKMAFGGGVKTGCGKQGIIQIGSGTCFTGDCWISVHQKLCIGENCLISWDTQIMDNDSHHILIEGKITNEDADVQIGNHVWIAGKVIISKGSSIPLNVVVASGSHINKKVKKEIV